MGGGVLSDVLFKTSDLGLFLVWSLPKNIAPALFLLFFSWVRVPLAAIKVRSTWVWDQLAGTRES